MRETASFSSSWLVVVVGRRQLYLVVVYVEELSHDMPLLNISRLTVHSLSELCSSSSLYASQERDKLTG